MERQSWARRWLGGQTENLRNPNQEEEAQFNQDMIGFNPPDLVSGNRETRRSGWRDVGSNLANTAGAILRTTGQMMGLIPMSSQITRGREQVDRQGNRIPQATDTSFDMGTDDVAGIAYEVQEEEDLEEADAALTANRSGSIPIQQRSEEEQEAIRGRVQEIETGRASRMREVAERQQQLSAEQDELINGGFDIDTDEAKRELFRQRQDRLYEIATERERLVEELAQQEIEADRELNELLGESDTPPLTLEEQTAITDLELTQQEIQAAREQDAQIAQHIVDNPRHFSPSDVAAAQTVLQKQQPQAYQRNRPTNQQLASRFSPESLKQYTQLQRDIMSGNFESLRSMVSVSHAQPTRQSIDNVLLHSIPPYRLSELVERNLYAQYNGESFDINAEINAMARGIHVTRESMQQAFNNQQAGVSNSLLKDQLDSPYLGDGMTLSDQISVLNAQNVAQGLSLGVFNGRNRGTFTDDIIRLHKEGREFSFRLPPEWTNYLTADVRELIGADGQIRVTGNNVDSVFETLRGFGNDGSLPSFQNPNIAAFREVTNTTTSTVPIRERQQQLNQLQTEARARGDEQAAERYNQEFQNITSRLQNLTSDGAMSWQDAQGRDWEVSQTHT